MHAGNPLLRPVQVGILILGVIINIVVVADIEGGIGKHQIHRTFFQIGQSRNAIDV